ncbi:MAG: phosphatidylserine decarboxylase family protein [Candidatus Heimdallarchaeota archaeon]|nr:phosphatidylserine decarboxylase family protein [Candidatus Heimdallarchaeota archaeon]
MFAKKSEPLLLITATLAVIPMFFIPLSLYVLIPFIFFIIATIFLMYFFRDPERIAPDEEGIMIAPVDGIVRKRTIQEDGSLLIQVELSVFNVHVNRAPIDCKVVNLQKEKGTYWPVWFKSHYSAENARQHFDLETNEGFTFRLTQISGIFAWRCVSFISIGQKVKRNDKIGIIRFGSAANVILPKNSGYEPTINIGEKLRAGETIIARRK